MDRAAVLELPVAVIGAGPVGLAAAAELVRRRIPVVVLEAGDEVGASVRAWGHVRMFSPWRYNIANPSRALLEAFGWQDPDADAVPTGRDLVSMYLEPLAAVPALKAALRFGTRVRTVTRLGLDKVRDADRASRPFLLRIEKGSEESDLLARAVIDCSGTFEQPNHGGAHGIPARGEARHGTRITYGMPDVGGADRGRYAGRRVAVLGSGHSATGVILELLALQQQDVSTQILWLSRRADLRLAFGGGAADALPARGALGSRLRKAVEAGRVEVRHPFALDEVAMDGGALRLTGTDGESVVADELVIATGFRPDLAMLGEVRLDLDPALECPRALASLIDPNIHSCGTVRPHGARELTQPDPGFYIAGMKSYGRAPTFLLATGYEQVRSIVAELAGDHAAAARVELELPETGVCSSGPARDEQGAASGCCGGPAKANASACCVRDEEVKAAGGAGCGCGSAAKPEPALAQAPGDAVAARARPGGCCG
ncbi:FAD-dependent oxidoreductase [Pannonibacter sp. SL95]|uniref:FAD-dependent oxidoreductase n=1 Tax=Pannonibacter sp. SL95 TaxID=2995153 RepID=UPI002275EFBA|nr:FAD-dependent oxidoreductase [Pannonibacter sp. SL95]MCY1707886.1 FAD-dependent oxidoreductase [Pannonibacter sp. SL95]